MSFGDFETLNRFPRWFLVLISMAGIAVSFLTTSFILKNAFADMVSVREVAFSAKRLSELNGDSIVDLKDDISELKKSHEKFNEEYREDRKIDRQDQKEDRKILQQVLFELKK